MPIGKQIFCSAAVQIIASGKKKMLKVEVEVMSSLFWQFFCS